MQRRITKRAQPLVMPHDRRDKYPTTYWMRAATSAEVNYHEACMTRAAEVVRDDDMWGNKDPYMESARIRTDEDLNLICHCLEKIEHCDPDGSLGEKIDAALAAGEDPKDEWLRGVTLTDEAKIRQYLDEGSSGINVMLSQACKNPAMLEQLRKPLASTSASGMSAIGRKRTSMEETPAPASNAEPTEPEVSEDAPRPSGLDEHAGGVEAEEQ